MKNQGKYSISTIFILYIVFPPCLTHFDAILPQYRADFPSSMKEHAVFADLAPRFQLLAEEILQRQVHLVIYNLKEVLPLLKCMQHL